MNITIYPSSVSGQVSVPASKSITHRALIAASLASGKSVLTNILLSDDTRHTIKALRSLGVAIEQENTKVIVQGTGGRLSAPSSPIFLGNSGTSMRLLTAVAALTDGITELTGEKRLCERPIGHLLSALTSIGIKVQTRKNNDCPPVIVEGGIINGGDIMLDASVSSQYLSALLLIAPFAKSALIIHVSNLTSKPYVDLTIETMKQFGIAVKNKVYQTFTIPSGQSYKASEYTVEGDYSSASYFFAAAAITGGKVMVKNLKFHSKQGDAYFLILMEQMGCSVQKTSDGLTIERKTELKAIKADLKDYPDIVQTLAVMAAFAKGKTTIQNIANLKHKETDRLTATSTELKKMGIEVIQTDNSLEITGGKPQGATIDTHNDHRMAMSFAVAGLGASGKTTIPNAEVVKKSYENFFTDLQKLGTKMEVASQGETLQD